MAATAHRARARTFLIAGVSALALCAGVGGAWAQTTIDGGSTETTIGDNSGTRPSPWNLSDWLYVGETTSGQLEILGGGQVSVRGVTVASAAGSTGSIRMSGAGSSLTENNGQTLSIGFADAGTLAIENGASASSNFVYLGMNAGGAGEATITGSGSTWTSNWFHVGAGGEGSLMIADGGSLTSFTTSIIGQLSGSVGEATVTGEDSIWTSGQTHIGERGTGTLTISDGGAVSSLYGTIGVVAGANGFVTVSGNDSIWSANNFQVGVRGAGTLTIEDGGEVFASGAVSVGVIDDGAGQLTITGNGSLRTSSNFAAGYGASGIVTITDGGLLFAEDLYLGQQANGVGTMSVADAASNVSVENFYAGYSGAGRLTIAEGGQVTVNGGVGVFHLGALAGSSGVLNIGAAAADPAAGAGTLNAVEVRLGSGASKIINFNHTDADYVFAPQITGSGAVNVLSGTTTLSGANTFTGPVTIGGGTLRLAGGAALDDAVAVTVESGATLDLQDSETVGVLSGAGAVTLNARILTVDDGGADAAFSGVISSSPGGSLRKQGAGTLTLSGANTFQVLEIQGGGVVMTGGAALPDASLVSGAGNLWIDTSQTIGAVSLGAGSVVTIAAGQTLTAGGATVAGTYSAAFTGAGAFVKVGTGTIRLAGTNTFTGGFTAAAGLTQLFGGAALADTVAVTVAAGATLQVEQSETIGSLSGEGGVILDPGQILTVGADDRDVDFAGVISGDGGLAKTGAGALTLTGASTYTGPTSVTGGQLVVNGSLASGMSVASGATLKGEGTYPNLTVAGAVAPGNSIGTITVNGPVTFATGSTYEAEIAANGTSDLIAATGTATIQTGTTLQVVTLDPLTSYLGGQAYTILTADGGRTGEFTTLDKSAFLDISATYTPTSAGLLIAPEAPPPVPPAPPPGVPAPPPVPGAPAIIPFPYFADTANQANAGLGAQFLAQSGDALGVFNTILMLGADEVPPAFDSLSGEIHASAQHAALTGAGLFQSALLRHGHAARREAGGAMLWAEVLGEGGRIEADGNAAEFEHRFAGAVFGAEGGAAALGGTLTGGVAAGFMDGAGSVDGRASASEIAAWRAGAYGVWSAGAFTLSGALAYGEADVDTTRSIGWAGLAPRTAESSRDMESVSATLEAAFDLPGAPMGFALSPLALLDYQALSAGAAQETGAGALDLAIAGEDFARLEAGFGLEARRAFAFGEASLRAVYRSAVEGDLPRQTVALSGAPAAPFAVAGPLLGDRLELGAGVSAALSDSLSLSLRYQASVSPDGDAHQGGVGLGWRF